MTSRVPAAFLAATVVLAMLPSAAADAETVRLRELEREQRLVEEQGDPRFVEQVTVTATQNELPSQRSAVPTQVVTREQIEALGTSDIEYVLETLPGVVVHRNTPFTLGATTVSLDGAEPDHVAVLLDGRPFLGGVDGVVDLRDVPIGNIERIEVVRGPGSALYGSQAMAGVINIITRGGDTDSSLDVTAGAGTFGRSLLEAAFGGSAGRLRYFVSAQTGSYRPEEQWGEISGQLTKDERQERDQAFLRLDLPFERSRLGFTGNYAREENPQSFDRNPSADLRWSRELTPGASVEVDASHYGYYRRNDAPGLEEQRDYDDRRAEARYKHAWFGNPVWHDHLLAAGWKLRREALESPALTTSTVPGLVPAPISAEVGQQTVWLQDEVFLGERWSLVGSVSFDDHELYGREASPRLAIAWMPWHRARVSAAWGEGFRAPDLLQLFDRDVNTFGSFGYQIVGNPDLLPETNAGWNLEFDHAGKRIAGFVNVYRQHYDDLITTEVASSSPLTFRYVNIAGAQVAGIDLGLDLDLRTLCDIGGAHRLDLGLNFGWLRTEGSSMLPVEDGNELPLRPAHTFSPVLRYAQPEWGTGLALWANRYAEQYTRLDNLETIEEHWLVDFKITQRIWRELALFVEGHNVTDQEPSPEVPVRTVGREGYLAGLTYNIVR